MLQHHQPDDGFAREPERLSITGVSESTWRRLELKGEAPARRQISPNAVGWIRGELREWVRTRAQKGAANVAA